MIGPEGYRVLLTRAEVAKIFGVHPRTVTNWAISGRLDCMVTPGGHRRFWEEDVKKMMEKNPPRGFSDSREVSKVNAKLNGGNGE
jgi:excisionase family DNA binding protein